MHIICKKTATLYIVKKVKIMHKSTKLYFKYKQYGEKSSIVRYGEDKNNT